MHSQDFARLGVHFTLGLLLLGVLLSIVPCVAIAQSHDGQRAMNPGADENAAGPKPPDAVRPKSASNTTEASNGRGELNLWQLIWTARWLMLPIGLMSFVVVTFGMERMLSLRRGHAIPRALVREVYRATESRSSFNPRDLFHVADEYPSVAANVFRAVLLKMGRPHDEVARAADETMQREAERLYRNVRPLNLAAAVTPLMGLLGTVWGMIQAFFATANLPVGANKAESLAEGIYTALVTTAGGLIVAIPAAILAHYFEGRIERILADIQDIVHTRLMPFAERLEGHTAKSRVNAHPAASGATPPPVVRPPESLPRKSDARV